MLQLLLLSRDAADLQTGYRRARYAEGRRERVYAHRPRSAIKPAPRRRKKTANDTSPLDASATARARERERQHAVEMHGREERRRETHSQPRRQSRARGTRPGRPRGGCPPRSRRACRRRCLRRPTRGCTSCGCRGRRRCREESCRRRRARRRLALRRDVHQRRFVVEGDEEKETGRTVVVLAWQRENRETAAETDALERLVEGEDGEERAEVVADGEREPDDESAD